MLKTFAEWSESGYHVIKGEKACKRIDGKCYFNENQVSKNKSRKTGIQKFSKSDLSFYGDLFPEDLEDEFGNYVGFFNDGIASNDDFGDFGDW